MILSFFIRKYRIFCLIVFSFLILSCKNEYLEYEGLIQDRKYLEAMELLDKFGSDPKKYRSYQKKLDNYLGQQGDLLLNRAFEQAIIYTKNYSTDEGIVYLSRLLSLSIKNEGSRFKIPGVESAVLKMQEALERVKDNFVSHHYREGVNDFNLKAYRKSYKHFSYVMKYAPSYTSDLLKYYNDSWSNASILLSLGALYINQNISKDRLLDNASRGSRPYYVQGIEVLGFIRNEFLKKLDKDKSEFVSLVSGKDKGSLYTIVMDIQLYEDDQTRIPKTILDAGFLKYRTVTSGKEWLSTYVSYTIKRLEYELTLNASVYIFDENAKLVRVLSDVQRKKGVLDYQGVIEGMPFDIVEFIAPPKYDYLPISPVSLGVFSQSVVEQCVQGLVNKISANLLNVLDK